MSLVRWIIEAAQQVKSLGATTIAPILTHFLSRRAARKDRNETNLSSVEREEQQQWQETHRQSRERAYAMTARISDTASAFINQGLHPRKTLKKVDARQILAQLDSLLNCTREWHASSDALHRIRTEFAVLAATPGILPLPHRPTAHQQRAAKQIMELLGEAHREIDAQWLTPPPKSDD